jgi:hypothetical protein
VEKLVKKDSTRTFGLVNIRPPPHYNDVRPQIITSDTVRQGPRGTRVLIVLVSGLIAIWFAFVVVYCFIGN